MGKFKMPISIYEATEKIYSNKFLLPAFQREFVWNDRRFGRIYRLFDSLMQDYPISSMLFWNIKKDSEESDTHLMQDYQYFEFLKFYQEDYHHTNASIIPTEDFYCVLDGQQRLTSLYLGLRGYVAVRKGGKKSGKLDDTEENYRKAHLYLNLDQRKDGDEKDNWYIFKFLEDNVTGNEAIYTETQKIPYEPYNRDIKWFKVGDILKYRDASILDDFLDYENLDKQEKRCVRRLRTVVFDEQHINYYLDDSDTAEKAVQIFLRINNGGKQLKPADMLLSIISSKWNILNSRDIYNLRNEINNMGFKVDESLIIRTILYLYHRDTSFKIMSMTNNFVNETEKAWPSIRTTMVKTFGMLKRMGFDATTLTANNAVLPILYYIHHRGIANDIEKTSFEADRVAMYKWLIKAQLLGSFNGSVETTIALSRMAYQRGLTEPTPLSITAFPTDELSSLIGQQKVNVSELIPSLLKIQKGERLSLMVLRLLYPYIDHTKTQYTMEQDHLHPQKSFDDYVATGGKHTWEEYNSIVNLQLLSSADNEQKNGKTLSEWVEANTQTSDKNAFCEKCLIPTGISLDIKDFDTYYEKRYELLSTKLETILSVNKAIQIETYIDRVVSDEDAVDIVDE